MAVFPEAKLFSGWNFPIKNEIQNSISEFATRYGMPAGDHCGDLADMMLAIGTGTGTGTGSPAPSGHRPPATATGCGQGCRTGRTATGCGHGQPRHRPPGPATGNARHGRTDRHRHGKPATVETWRSAGTVAAGFKQKAGNP